MSGCFNITKQTKIYVLCPANLKTGGTELLHQLVFCLKSLGRESLIAYYFEGNYEKDNPTPDEFKKYIENNSTTIDLIEDENKNIVVFPEVCIGKQRRFKRIQKCVWWLSVDNFKEAKGKINRLKKYGVLSFLKHLYLNDYVSIKDIKRINIHLYQSYFALDYIKSLGINENCTAHLSDYLNDIYKEQFELNNDRDNIVIYNPKKGKEFTSKLIESADDIEFVPIINMTNSQVFDLMHRAKVYIDFGNHPGKDRIPREAAMCGCCIITGRRGSAGYSKDVPIPEEYKIPDTTDNITIILQQIKKCFLNYDNINSEFDSYREIIRNEKCQFNKDVSQIFSLSN